MSCLGSTAQAADPLEDAHAGTPTDTIRLKNGDTLRGLVTEQTDQHIVLQHELLGQLRLPQSTIAQVDTTTGLQKPQKQDVAAVDADLNKKPQPSEAENPAEQTVSTDGDNASRAQAVAELKQDIAQEHEQPAKKTGLLEWLAHWSHNVDLSFTGAQGVSRYNSYLIGYKANRKDDQERTDLQTRWYQLDDDISGIEQTKAHLQLQQDWFLEESSWFPFVRGRWDYDNRQFWEQRYEGFAGMGYTLSESEKVEANLRVAGGLVHEKYGIDRTRGQSLLSAALLRWQLNEQQDISGEATFYPKVNADDTYRVNARVEWRVRLAAIDGMSLKLGLENEFESATEDDPSKNDLLYFAGVSLDF